VSAATPSNEPTNANALLRDGLVWDNHGCMPVARPHDVSFMPQLQRYRASGVDAVILDIGFGDMSIEDHVRTAASMRHWLSERPAEYGVLERPRDDDLAQVLGGDLMRVATQVWGPAEAVTPV